MSRSIFMCALSLLLFTACGESDAERAKRLADSTRADSVRRADSLAALLRPREEVYNAAVALVKSRLKAPSTARFAGVTLVDDTVKIELIAKDTASVYGEYDAQNSFGTYLHSRYKVRLRRDSSGAWVGRSGMEILDVNMDYNELYDIDREKK